MSVREDRQIGAMIAEMLAARRPDATLCPSEVARALAGEDGDWRARMGEVHSAVDGLVAAGAVRLSWKGAAMAARGGPYRIGRVGNRDEDG
ncbi:DUF3253 domain-containing protein [Sphingomonas aestuarii]